MSAHSLSNFEADPGVLLLGEEAYDLRKKLEKRDDNLAMQEFDEAKDVQEYYTQPKECPIDPHTGKRVCRKKKDKSSPVLLPRYE
eukprot:790598-Pleurochrysis_carterae.AAC.1